MAMSGEERKEVFGEMMDIERRVNSRLDKVAACARRKIDWPKLVFFVAMAAAAIGFVWYNLSGGLSENRAATQGAVKDVLELKGDVRAIRESFEDFRAEQRAINREVLQELGAIRKQMPKGE